MEREVRKADHILVIASAAYRERAEGESGPDVGRGVQWEARLIRNAFYRGQRALDRFVPVVLPEQSKAGVPDFLAPETSTIYTVTEFTEGAMPLLRLLLGQPEESEPPLGPAPDLGTREPTLSAPPAPLPGPATLWHRVEVHVEVEDARVRVRTVLAGTVLGEHVGSLPPGLGSCWVELDSPTGTDRLVSLGHGLWRALFDESTGRRIEELIVGSPIGTAVDVVMFLPAELAGLPVELLRLPDGRLAANAPGVRLTRRLAGIERSATPPLAGPLKILAAVAAPEETRTPNAPLDVEAEMQALLDAVTGLDGSDPARAQVQILEVASLAEITRALAATSTTCCTCPRTAARQTLS